ncbi:MAG: hypothetical protein ACLTKE_14195 [Coprococcus sp.]
MVYENEEKFTAHELDKSCLNIKDITAFANEVKIADVKGVLMRQIEYQLCDFRGRPSKYMGSSDWKDYQGRRRRSAEVENDFQGSGRIRC